MRFTKLGTSALALAAVGAAVLAATPASAHGAPFTVTAGSAAAGMSVPITLTTSGSSPQFVWKDTTTGITESCTSVVIKGSLSTGSTGGRVGTIDAARSVFNGCNGPGGIGLAITGVGTWTVDVSDSTAGLSTLTIGNLRAHLVATSGPTCSWDFAAQAGPFTSSSSTTTTPGAVAASYTNASTLVALPATNPGSLGLWNVRGTGTNTYCISPSVWKQGDRMSWSANWNVAADTAANNPVAIN